MRKAFMTTVLLMLVPLSVLSDQQVIESGRFFFQIEEDVGVEGFEFIKLDSGNVKLKSEFEALSETLVVDFGTDKIFTQEVILTPGLELISYELNSDTDRGSIQVRVSVENSVATIRWEAREPGEEPEERERQVILEENIVTTGIAASQFFLFQKFINEKLELDVGEPQTLTAFDPTNVESPFVTLSLERLTPVILEDVRTKQQFKAQRTQVEQEEFRAELLSCASDEPGRICDSAGRFLGFVSSTASLAGVRLAEVSGEGVRVESVASGSFAAQAGLQEGDVIVAVDGRQLDDIRELRELIRFKNPEEPVTLTVMRDGEHLEMDVRLSGSSLTVFRFDLFEGGFAILGEATP